MPQEDRELAAQTLRELNAMLAGAPIEVFRVADRVTPPPNHYRGRPMLDRARRAAYKAIVLIDGSATTIHHAIACVETWAEEAKHG
jgi:hypothetical protein